MAAKKPAAPKADGNHDAGTSAKTETKAAAKAADNDDDKKAADTTGDNAAAATGAKGEVGLKKDGDEIPGEGEVIQTKPTLGEALAGQADGIEGVGEGSVEERAPRIMGAVVQATKNDREVRQGDEVILHTRSLLNGKLENAGVMLKANADGSIAVRVPLQTGGTRDFSPVYNGPQNGEDWFSVADQPQGLRDGAE